jgi:glycine cleavage system aminomethyltransferase T
VVTSSTVSPMRGAASIAFALVRASHMDPGTRVLVNADGGSEPATVTDLDLEIPRDAAEPSS